MFHKLSRKLAHHHPNNVWHVNRYIQLSTPSMPGTTGLTIGEQKRRNRRTKEKNNWTLPGVELPSILIQHSKHCSEFVLI